MSQNFHLLIVGSGSVGKRHAGNMSFLGCQISCMDPRAERNVELAAETPVVGSYVSYEDALLAAGDFDGVVICSPPSKHVEQTMACIKNGIPVLLEKPVCPDLQGAALLLEAAATANSPVLLGYTWRWWPPLVKVKALLEENAIGRLRHVRFVLSAHLADWHPWERYQDFFMAKKELGGGALLDESHWIDLCCWMFGEPGSVSARIDKLSSLEIDTDDNVDMLLTYANQFNVSLHLDLYGRPHEKSITFVGEDGSIKWSAEPNQVVIGRNMSDWDDIELFNCERNEMFMSVARDFLNLLAGDPALNCSLHDGLKVLRIIEAARTSSREGRVVTLEEIN